MKEEPIGRDIGVSAVSRYFAFVGTADQDRIMILKTISAYLTKKGHSVAIIKQIPNLELFKESQKRIGYEYFTGKLVAYVSPEGSDLALFGKDHESQIFQLAEDTADYILLDGFDNFPDTPKVVILGATVPGENMGSDIVAVIGTHDKTLTHPLYKTESELPTLVETLALPPNPNLNCEKCGFPNCKAFRAMVLKGKTAVNGATVHRSPGQPDDTPFMAAFLIEKGEYGVMRCPCTHTAPIASS